MPLARESSWSLAAHSRLGGILNMAHVCLHNIQTIMVDHLQNQFDSFLVGGQPEP